MHTEHLQNIRASAVFFGWFVCVALVSLFALLLAAFGLVDPESAPAGGLVGMMAIAAGFFIGGWFIGVRVGIAPILHGIAIGMVSLLVWFVANLVFGEWLGATTWDDGSPVFYAGSLILQMVAASAGASIGARAQRRPAGARE